MKANEIKIEEKSKFYKLEVGDNELRIVSDFAEKETTFEDGSKAIRYACLVIDRKDGQVKEWEFAKSIMKQIHSLATSKDYAFDDMPKYDMTVNRVGTGKLDTVYTLRAARQDSALTEAEVAAVTAYKLGGEVTLDQIPF